MAAARRPRMRSGFRTLRDAVSYVAGLAVIGHEVVAGPPEPWLLLVGMGLVGLPLALGGRDVKPPPPPP